nr:hypothetical protein [Corynebacterium macginleyi]
MKCQHTAAAKRTDWMTAVSVMGQPCAVPPEFETSTAIEVWFIQALAACRVVFAS